MSWLLVFTLLYVQQETGTPVRTEIHRFENIASEKLCEDAGKALVKTHTMIGTEPTTDYDGEDSQPLADQFRLLRPYATCIQIR